MEITLFESTLQKYEDTIWRLLGTKYGISLSEFCMKATMAVKKNPKLLQCTPASIFGSIMYFAEIGLPFNTPEQFGYIIPYQQKGVLEATPIIGYKGLIEIAYRNPKMKSIRIQAVYDADEFEYAYGTEEYLKHKPAHSNRGALKCVYAVAKLEGIDPIFVVVNKDELLRIQKLSKSGSSEFSPYNNGTDVFNIMQSKVALKLLFKTLPKTDNEILIRTLEFDNKFDYQRNVRIQADEKKGYVIVEKEETKQSALAEVPLEPLQIETKNGQDTNFSESLFLNYGNDKSKK